MTTDTNDANDDTELHSTVGPDIALSEEDRDLARRLTETIEQIDTLEQEDLREIREQKYPNTALWDDEAGTGWLEMKYRPAALDLPGFGAPYDGSDGKVPCGAKIPHVCPDCGDTIDVGRTCYRSVCKRCAPAWVLDRAVSIVKNIHKAAKMKDGTQYKHHAVLSPPPDILVDAEDPEDELMEAAKDFMREIDFDGAAFYHPYTGKNESDTDIKDLEEDDRGKWKSRLFNGRDWENDVREELQVRPHIHLVGCCEWFPGGDVVKKVHDETGWVIKRLTGRNGSSISIGDIDALARVVCYCLSHTAIDTRGENNRYVHAKIGSAYHAEDKYEEQNKQEARRAVNQAVNPPDDKPDVLGIDAQEVSCYNEVPAEECDEHDADDLEEEIDEDATADDSDEEPSMRTCGSQLDTIDEADYVDDEEWQSGAIYSDEAVEARREWEELGGWQGWMAEQTGQAVLPDVGDDPPD